MFPITLSGSSAEGTLSLRHMSPDNVTLSSTKPPLPQQIQCGLRTGHRELPVPVQGKEAGWGGGRESNKPRGAAGCQLR